MLEFKTGKRFKVYIFVLSVIVIVLIGRLVQLMVVLPEQARSQTLDLPAVERGNILDRNGRILAISSQLDSISAWIPSIEDPERTARLLSQTLNLDEKSLLSGFEDNPGHFFIKRKITPTESDKIQLLLDDNELKGIYLETEFGRNYPNETLASQVIGAVGIDNTGQAGIEYTLNDFLRPPVISTEKNIVFGNQVFLTIDINIQYQLEKIASRVLDEHKADYVMLLVMDAKTGEILGYTSVPSFDPNEYSEYFTEKKETLINRPIQSLYEPGSVFKMFTLSSFLQIGGIEGDEMFYCNGYYEKEVGDKPIRIKCLDVHGEVDARLILKYSCNAGAAYASETVDPESFYNVLINFGFGNHTNLPLPAEREGLLAEPMRWSTRTKPTIAFGQEISVTAVQMITAATALANQGILLKPLLIHKIVSPEGKVIQENKRTPVRAVLSPEVAVQVLQLLESTSEEGGTAWRARIEGVRISGKTGTSQVIDAGTGKYSENRFVASFLGIFPTEDPQMIVYVVINNPKGESHYGGVIATPVFKEVALELISYLGINSREDRVMTHSGSVSIKIPEKIEIGSIMPDLIGVPKRNVLPLFSQSKLTVVIDGEGYVVGQKPEPGVQLEGDTKIFLEFK